MHHERGRAWPRRIHPGGRPSDDDTQAAEQDAADLGESAAGEGNQPGTATDEAESRVQQAVDAANAVAEETGGMGEPGRPMNRRSPFYIGLTGAAGVAVTYGLVELFARSRSILIIIGLGLFIAVGLDPVASWLTRRGMPRWAAVLVVLAGLVGIIGIFLAIAIPPLTSQTTALAKQVPTYLHQLQNHNSELGKLNQKYQIQQKLTNLLTSKGSSVIGGVLGAGALVISTFSSALAVLVLTVYFLAGLPSIKLFAYHLVPHSRRPRVILITDQIFVKVGGYVLGNVLTRYGRNAHRTCQKVRPSSILGARTSCASNSVRQARKDCCPAEIPPDQPRSAVNEFTSTGVSPRARHFVK